MARIQRHPYNSVAFRLCKCTDLAPFTPAVINYHWKSADSHFLTVVYTLHREQAPVAKRGFVSEQGTGSLNRVLSRSQFKKPTVFSLYFFSDVL